MKFLFLGLTACLIAPVLSAAEKFSFVRPVLPGSCFECRVQTRQSARYSFRLPGVDDPIVKQDSVQALFQGYLTVRDVKAAGSPSRMKIRADHLSGSINGRTTTADLPGGTDIEAVRTDGRSVFSSGAVSLTPEHSVLLSVLFPPPCGTLADLAGLDRLLEKPGQGWKPDLTLFLKQLARRGILLKPSAFKSGVTYHGREKYGRFDCRKFTLLIESCTLSDYDCRLKITFWIAPSGPPVRIVRDATEVIRQVPRSGEPFAAGTRIELFAEDHTEQVLVPVERIPPAKKRGTPSGGWDVFLH